MTVLIHDMRIMEALIVFGSEFNDESLVFSDTSNTQCDKIIFLDESHIYVTP